LHNVPQRIFYFSLNVREGLIIVFNILQASPNRNAPIAQVFVKIKAEFVFNFLAIHAQGSFAFIALLPVVILPKLIELIVKHVAAEGQIPETVLDQVFKGKTLGIVPLFDERIGTKNVNVFSSGFLG